MDPLWYMWFAMLMAVWYQRHTQGVRIWTRHGPRRLGPQATVDDTVIPVNDRIVVEQEANAALQHGAWMNLINNADKFDLVHLVPVKEGAMDAGRGAVLVDGQGQATARLCQAPGRRYQLLLPGHGRQDGVQSQVQGHAGPLAPACAGHGPSAGAHPRGLDQCMDPQKIKAPADLLAWQDKEQHVAAAVASVANLVRKLYRLPFKTPWRFIFGDQGRGALGMPHPAHCLWGRFVAELYSAMCSVHLPTRLVTQWEVQPSIERRCCSERVRRRGACRVVTTTGWQSGAWPTAGLSAGVRRTMLETAGSAWQTSGASETEWSSLLVTPVRTMPSAPRVWVCWLRTLMGECCGGRGHGCKRSVRPPRSSR